MSIKSSLLTQNRALYLPAISETFARSVHRGSLAPSLPLTASDLNFLDPNNRSFFYPFALYSAGQAARSNGRAAMPCMVTQRDRAATVVVGDSGGYQIQTGKIEFDPDKTAPTMLRWLEQTTDWSMVLDFPTGRISRGGMRVHAERLRRESYDLEGMSRANGLAVDYNACLTQTKINNRRFVEERTPGATRLLNVLQGRNERESKHWYHAVKDYPFEGWAFAGAHKDHFSLILRRLLDMHSDGLLAGCKWIHVLGVGSLQIGCLLTAVQRAVRDVTGNEVQFMRFGSQPREAQLLTEQSRRGASAGAVLLRTLLRFPQRLHHEFPAGALAKAMANRDRRAVVSQHNNIVVFMLCPVELMPDAQELAHLLDAQI